MVMTSRSIRPVNETDTEPNSVRNLKPLKVGAVAVDWGVQGFTRLALDGDWLTLTIYRDAINTTRWRLPLPEAGIAAMSANGPAIVDCDGVLWYWPWSPGSSGKRKVSWKRAAALDDGKLIDASTSEPVKPS
jgi:hypothetical protein